MTPADTSVLSPSDYIPDLSLSGRINRRLVFWNKIAPLSPPERSIITFSFDDFPKSAADTGADILTMIGAKAIYYACSGLAGRSNQTGEQYIDTDMLALDRAGHEIGAHTHTHLDCARARTDQVIADIDTNLSALHDMGLPGPVTNFAYPYGETTHALKKALKTKFMTARGILPGPNHRRSDRMQLAAYELTPDPATTERASAAIEAASRTPGWLHIFTHDVRAKPSPYGTTPQAFKSLVRHARDSGLKIALPRDTIKQVGDTYHV